MIAPGAQRARRRRDPRAPAQAARRSTSSRASARCSSSRSSGRRPSARRSGERARARADRRGRLRPRARRRASTPTGAVWFSDVTNGGVFRIARRRRARSRRSCPGAAASAAIVPHAAGGVIVTGKDVLHVARRRHAAAGLRGARGQRRHGLQRLRRPTRTGGCSSARSSSGRWPASRPCRAGSWSSRRGSSPSRSTRGSTGPTASACRPTATAPTSATTRTGACMAIDVDRQGALAETRATCSPTRRSGSCDGLAVDVEGGVWVATGEGGGLARFVGRRRDRRALRERRCVCLQPQLRRSRPARDLRAAPSAAARSCAVGRPSRACRSCPRSSEPQSRRSDLRMHR